MKTYIAGHRGLVGSALHRLIPDAVVRDRSRLDLTATWAVDAFFRSERPDVVYLAAAKVGGIRANSESPADFIRTNLQIQTNVIEACRKFEVKRLAFFGSTCLYPRDCPQPIREESLLSGPLEATNSAYAVAKIAGIEMCRAYNQQYGTKFLCLQPSNLYGPGDNYREGESHVLPALIRRFHEAKQPCGKSAIGSVTVWGTGTPRREFLYSDDLASSAVFLMNLPDVDYDAVLNSWRYPLINVGSGTDVTIRELAESVAETVGYDGGVTFDASQPDGVPQKLADSSRLFALGWRPKVSLGEGLRLAYQDFLKGECRV